MAKVFNVGGGGGGGGVYLEYIAVITLPDKTVYKTGQSFSSAGMVVTAYYSKGLSTTVTGYSITPQGPLAYGTTEVTVSYSEGGNTRTTTVPITVLAVLEGLRIDSAPTKTTYEYGDTLNTAGLKVSALYSDGTAREVTGYTLSPTTFTSLGSQRVTASYTDEDGTVTASFTVTVERKTIPVPSQSGTLTYTGSAQSPAWSGYSAAQLTIGGTTSAANAGSYTATFTPTANYRWPDGSTGAKSVTWSIGRAIIAAVPSQSGSLTYTGSAQSPTWTGYDSGKMSIGGATSGTNAGSYTATFTPGSNYQWSDGGTGAKSVSWSIAKAAGSMTLSASAVTLTTSAPTATITVDRPGDGAISAVSGNTGVATVSVSGNKVTISGVNNTNGSTTVTIKVAAGTNHTAPADKTVSVTASFTVYIQTVPAQSGSLTYNGNAQGPTWSNYNSTQLSLGGTTSAVNAGTYTATFTPNAGYAWSDGSTAAKNVTWSIGKAAGSLSVSPTSLTLTTASPTGEITVTRAGDGAISAVSNAPDVATVSVSGNKVTVTGKASGNATITISVAAGTNHTAPGNKTVGVSAEMLPANFADATWAQIIEACQANTVPDTWVVGNTKPMTIGGTDYTIRILGKNHDDFADGSGKAPLTLEMAECYATTYAMNSSNTNKGGWRDSAMRNTHLPAIMALMPSEVRAGIKPVNKKASAGNKSTTIYTTEDNLFLLSEIEIFGNISHSVAGEGSQYAWYKAGNPARKELFGSSWDWWERSPKVTNERFCGVYFDGGSSPFDASTSNGVSYAFCFGKRGEISFTIGGTAYKALEGMTWQEYIDSEYNTAGVYVGESGRLLMSGGELYGVNTGVPLPGTVIVSGEVYRLIAPI